jgi:hypothetical protein
MYDYIFGRGVEQYKFKYKNYVRVKNYKFLLQGKIICKEKTILLKTMSKSIIYL